MGKDNTVKAVKSYTPPTGDVKINSVATHEHKQPPTHEHTEPTTLNINADDNMELWNKVCVSNPLSLKEVKIGAYKFTTIDAYMQIEKATSVFGAMGKTWGLTSMNWELIREKDVIVQTALYAVFYYPGGSLPMATENPYRDSSGIIKDVRKKLTTDILTKSLSYLGFNFDVFEGKFNDNKYLLSAQEEATQKEEAEKLMQAAKNWKVPPGGKLPQFAGKTIAEIDDKSFLVSLADTDKFIKTYGSFVTEVLLQRIQQLADK